MNCRCSAAGSGLPLAGQDPGLFRAYAAEVDRTRRRARAIVRSGAVFFIDIKNIAAILFDGQARRASVPRRLALLR
jgi:hypothetical protein